MKSFPKTGLCNGRTWVVVVVVVVVVVGECEPILEVSLVAETECGPEAGGLYRCFFFQGRNSNRALSSDTRDDLG
jgi:hypothetical protein